MKAIDTVIVIIRRQISLDAPKIYEIQHSQFLIIIKKISNDVSN